MMITSNQVITQFINRIDTVIELLNEIGFYNINNDNKKEIRCSYDKNSNPTSVCIKKDTLYCTVFSKNIKGNIYTLFMWKTGLKFIDIHQLFLSRLEDVKFEVKKPKRQLFGGILNKNTSIDEYKIYSNNELDKFERANNLRFYDDNIFLSTQNKFDLRYDNQSNRIVIPWRDEYANIVGAVGRINYETESEDVAKYLAILKFKKTDHLFNIDKAINDIMIKNSAIIVEAEKSCMKAVQMNINNVVAVGCHSISRKQVIKLSRNCGRIIIAFDEGIEQYEILETCKSIENYFDEILYIFDEDNLFLEKGSKKSTFDLNYETLRKCITKCTVKFK